MKNTIENKVGSNVTKAMRNDRSLGYAFEKKKKCLLKICFKYIGGLFIGPREKSNYNLKIRRNERFEN